MQEVLFLKQNASKWRRLEHLLSTHQPTDPDELAELFIEVTNDLSYAKTFFPNSKATQYLNTLAARVHQAIYRNKKENRSRLVQFWAYELPATFRQAHRQMLYAFLIFMISVFIGVISTGNDSTFVRLILGDRYVNYTLHNIEKKDPMAIYKSMNQIDMFLGITINNIKVAFYCFAAGILFSIGTVFLLFYNGVMLGVFQYFFHQHGLLLAAASVIWIHGTLEISSIIVAGSAGLVMGNSLLFPGTYTRRQSLMQGAAKGIKIVIGLVPLFMIAAFLEGFVTRYTNMPLALNLTIILGSLTFVVWYFILYPFRLASKKPDNPQPFIFTGDAHE